MIRQAFDGVRLSEGTGVRTLSWFLEGSAARVYGHYVYGGVRGYARDRISWAALLNTLLERFLTDDVISDAHLRVITAAQKSDETEMDYAARLEGYADVCSGVYDDNMLTHQFICGLLPTTQTVVADHV